MRITFVVRAVAWMLGGFGVGTVALGHPGVVALACVCLTLGLVLNEMYHRARAIIEARNPRRLEETRRALALCLRSWQEESGQGDGISEEYADDFEGACALLGIAVVRTGVAYECSTYRCEPSFDQWLAINAPKKGLRP